jgi:hypothetical protein
MPCSDAVVAHYLCNVPVKTDCSARNIWHSQDVTLIGCHTATMNASAFTNGLAIKFHYLNFIASFLDASSARDDVIT